MKTFKRLTAMAVAVVFVLTSLVGVTVFAEDDSIFSDVPETNGYYEAITSLVADGVINGYDDGTFKPDATITRAEFSKLLAVGSTPVGTAFTQTTTQFADVADASSSSAWAIPYIAYAVGIKAINGYEDGTFRPTNPVTYGEAVKMIVCTLGYGSVVDTTLTPWYQGYVDIAFKIGLTKNAFAQGDTPAPRALVAQLVYNMQSCPVYVPSPDGTSGSTNNWGGTSSGLTNEETDEGILLGVFDYCLTGEGITKSQVLIDDDIYQIGSLDREELKELVGYAVTFKYSNTKKPELTRVSKTSGENKVTEIEDWQIVSVDGDAIEYYADEDAEDDDEVTKVSFDKDLYVIYNGVIVDTDDITDEFISEYFNVENGTVKLISNDGNVKSAEVAVVESYITYFVNTVSTSDGVTTFYDKYQKHTGLSALSLDEDEVASVKKVSTKGGKLTDSTLTGITAKSITSVAIPYGTKEGTSVIVSSVKFTGTVNELSSNYSKIKIGTEYYETAPYFDLLLDKGENVGFEVGDSGTFYLDHLGRIVFYEKTESTNPYALLVQYKSTAGMNASYALNISKSSKDLEMYLLEEKVKINGDTMKAEDAIAFLKNNAPYYDDAKPNVIIQPIKYKSKTTNGNNVITEMECIDFDDPESGNIVPYAFKNSVNSDKEYFANNGTLTYSKSGYAFKHGSSTQFRMNSSTAVFVVPSDVTKASGYSKKTYSYFTNNASYKVEAYDVEGEIAKLVVVYGSSTKPTIYAQTPVYLVEDIRDKEDDNGQYTKLIEYYQAGKSETDSKLVDIDSDAADVMEDIKAGDLIKFVTEDNMITSIKKVFAASELLNETGSFKVDGHHIAKDYESTKDYYQVIYGTVRSLDLDNNTISVIPGVDDDVTVDANYETINIDDSTVYYEYDNKKAFEISSAGAISPTFSDYIDADEDAGRENAKRIVAVIINKKVTAVYILS